MKTLIALTLALLTVTSSFAELPTRDPEPTPIHLFADVATMIITVSSGIALMNKSPFLGGATSLAGVTTGVAIFFGGFSSVILPTLSSNRTATSQDTLRKIRKSDAFNQLVRALGREKVEEFLLDAYSGWRPEAMIEKYLTGQDQSDVLNLLSQDRRVVEAALGGLFRNSTEQNRFVNNFLTIRLIWHWTAAKTEDEALKMRISNELSEQLNDAVNNLRRR